MQVVSFTYFESTRNHNDEISRNSSANAQYHIRRYFEGIAENLKRVFTSYPKDWNMRLYINGKRKNDALSICKHVCAINSGEMNLKINNGIVQYYYILHSIIYDMNIFKDINYNQIY